MSTYKLLEAIQEGYDQVDGFSIHSVDVDKRWVAEAFSELDGASLLRSASSKARMIFDSGLHEFLESMSFDVQEEICHDYFINQEARKASEQLIAESGLESVLDPDEVFDSYRIYLRKKVKSDYVRTLIHQEIQRWLSHYLGPL